MVKLKYAILQIASVLAILYFMLFKSELNIKDLVYVNVWCAIYASSLIVTYIDSNNNNKKETDEQQN